MKNHLFNMHHKIKLKLDAICQEAGDMNVEQFLKVYEELGDVNTKANIADDSVHEIIELKNANKLAHERIKELEEQYAIEREGDVHVGLYVSNLDEENAKLKERIKELEQQVAKYDFLD